MKTDTHFEHIMQQIKVEFYKGGKTLKLFIIELNEDLFVDYDQFDGFIIRTIDEERAWELAEELVNQIYEFGGKNDYFFKERFNVKELKIEGEEGIILSSYHAG